MALLIYTHVSAGKRRTRVRLLAALLVALVMSSLGTRASTAVAPIPAISRPAAQREYQVKAVFLLNFARFVDWPADAFASETAPLELGVLGQDPFGGYLDDAIRGENVNRRPIVVRRFQHLEDITTCHVLFIARSEASRLEQVLAALDGRGILTVSDAAGFADKGGMIGFVKHNEKVRLQINLDAARDSRLTISAKLLRPSEIVGNWKRRQLLLHDRANFPWGSEAGRLGADPSSQYAVRPTFPTGPRAVA